MHTHDPSSQALEWFRVARSVVVLTDADMSAESRMPVFGTDQMGSLTRHVPATFDTEFMYRTNSEESWGWHLWRLAATRKVTPHAGHRALAPLATALPGLTVITPNIDDLHERAGLSEVIHLRGCVFVARCMGCGHIAPDVDVPPYAADRTAVPVAPPRCPMCGDVVCPEVVRGDGVDRHAAWQQAGDVMRQCDLLIVVGTMKVDYPETSLPTLAQEHGAHGLEINPVRSKLSPLADLLWPTTAGHGLSLIHASVGMR
jgi:NAD-dependent deacetylase